MDPSPQVGGERARGARTAGLDHLSLQQPPHQPGMQGTDSAPPMDQPVERATNSKGDRPPRPMNAWLLFRTAQVKQFQEDNPDERRAQGQLSKVISELWKSASAETKREYEALAREKKEEHARLYPDYRYAPREKATKSTKSRRRSTPSQGQTPLRTPAAGDSASRVASSSSTAFSALDPMNRSLPPSTGPASSSRAQVGYHPYGPRSHTASPLPPIDTSHASFDWQPITSQSRSVTNAYSNQTWPTLSRSVDDRPQYRNSGPVSAPPDFTHHSANGSLRPGFELSSYGGHQYSPTWPPSASTSHSQLSYSGSNTSANTIHPSFPSPNTLPALDPVQSFDYSLYRAPVPTYHPNPLPPTPPSASSNNLSTTYRPTPMFSSQAGPYDYSYEPQPYLTGAITGSRSSTPQAPRLEERSQPGSLPQPHYDGTWPLTQRETRRQERASFDSYHQREQHELEQRQAHSEDYYSSSLPQPPPSTSSA